MNTQVMIALALWALVGLVGFGVFDRKEEVQHKPTKQYIPALHGDVMPKKEEK